MNLQSVMGLIMLVGIVVNNAIVLVDAINLLRRERGLSPVEAVVEAGRLRLRPTPLLRITSSGGWGAGTMGTFLLLIGISWEMLIAPLKCM